MRKVLPIICVLLSSFVLLPSLASAQDGTLDPSFGTGGKTIFNIGTSNDYSTSSALQADGKLVVVGYTNNGSGADFAAARYNTDGTLDQSFGTGGKLTIDVLGHEDSANCVAIQSDGKIVIAGHSSNLSYFLASMVRLNTDGTLDNTFGTAGKASAQLGWANGFIFAMGIQPDGKIVLGGSAYMGGKYTFSLARFTTSGALDNTFGTNGVTVSNGLIGAYGPGSDAIMALALQSDGKIVVGGRAYNGGLNVFTMARYSTAGALDNTFGTNGVTIINVGSGSDSVKSIQIQTDGKILAAGTGNNGSTNNAVIARYTSAGVLDNTFNSTGVQAQAFGSAAGTGNDIALRSDGKIWFTGMASNGSNNDFAVALLNTDGSLNNSFSGDGILLIDIQNNQDVATAVNIQSDGNILLSGYAYISVNNSNYNFAVTRCLTDGTIDATYGTAGIVNTNIGTNQDYSYSAAVQSDGHIIMGGNAFTGYGNNFAMLRYNSNGVIDASFGTAGKILTSVGNSSTTPDDQVRSVLLSGNKIILAGAARNTNYDFAVVQYNSDGTLDNSFGTGGKVMTDIGSNTYDYANSALLQPDGKIVLGGYSINPTTSNDFALVRYNSDGTIDNSFGTAGKVVTAVGSGSAYDAIYSIALQPDGKIVAVGRTGAADFAVVRYNTDGSLDNTFNGTGIVITDVNTSSYDVATGVSILPFDGTIVVTGNVFTGGKYVFATLRYNSNGTLDNSFNTNGKVLTAVGVSSAFSQSVIAQLDGKILVGGYANSGGRSGFAVARYNRDGSADNSFGTSGQVISTIGTGTSDNGQNLILQPDGNVLLTGYSSNGPNNDFAMARYLNTVATPLPLQWGPFTATKTADNNILLKWQTQQEENTKDFLVQHSTNTTDWDVLTDIPAAGSGSNSYTWLHVNPAATTHYYRLKERDLDNNEHYSETRTVTIDKQSSSLLLLENPVKGRALQFSISGDVNAAIDLSFYSIGGTLLWQKNMSAGTYSVDVSNYAKGVYILKAGTQTKTVVLQ